MATEVIGRVKGGSTRKTFDVKWDSFTHEVYVGYAGSTFVGKASSAGEAMRKAEAWVYDK